MLNPGAGATSAGSGTGGSHGDTGRGEAGGLGVGGASEGLLSYPASAITPKALPVILTTCSSPASIPPKDWGAASVAGDGGSCLRGTGLGLGQVTSAEVEELDEDIGQKEKDAAAAQAAEGWGSTLGFLGGGSVSQDSSLYLNHNQEADGE